MTRQENYDYYVYIQRQLEALDEDAPESIKRAIITLNAMAHGIEVDEQGRPLRKNGKPMAWSKMMP